MRTARFNDLFAPLVSIILHCRNDARYLSDCFDSILSQNYDNIEIVFYDFASTDNSWDIALEYQQANPGVITLLKFRKDYFLDNIIDHKENIRGKYYMSFFCCGSMEPGLVEQCVNILEKHRDVGLVKIRNTDIDVQGIKSCSPLLYESSCILSGHSHIIHQLMLHPDPNSEISMFVTDISNQLNGGPGYMNELELSLNCNVAFIANPLFCYRQKKEHLLPSETEEFTQFLKLYCDKILFLKKLFFVHGKPDQDFLQTVNCCCGHQALLKSVRALANNQIQHAAKFSAFAQMIAPEIVDTSIFRQIMQRISGDQLNINEDLEQRILSEWAVTPFPHLETSRPL